MQGQATSPKPIYFGMQHNAPNNANALADPTSLAGYAGTAGVAGTCTAYGINLVQKSSSQTYTGMANTALGVLMASMGMLLLSVSAVAGWLVRKRILEERAIRLAQAQAG
jgi:Tfp pilus assembly protein PilX